MDGKGSENGSGNGSGNGGSPPGWSRSLWAALGLLAGIAASQGLPRPAIAAAVALGGLAGALPWRLGAAPLGLAAGLVAGWCAAVPPPADIALGRPVVVTARQVGDWELLDDRWSTAARLETVRQGARVRRWGVDVRMTFPGEGDPPGRRWRLRGDLRRPPALANGEAARAPPWLLRVKSERLLERLPASSAGGRLADSMASLRASLRGALAAVAPHRPGSSLARALALGDAAALPEPLLRGLRRTGTAHVVALSGLHLGVIAGWCALAGRRLGRRRRFLAVLLGTLAYLVLGGARPSLVRAWIMVAAAGAAALAGRPARPAHALAWAAALLAAREPGCVRDLGYQLTFAATGGVLLGLRILPRWWRRAPRPVAVALGSSIGAQIATLPIAVSTFHWLPLWAWLWNLLIVPAVALAVPLCMAWTLLAAACPPAAAATVAPLDLLAGWLALPASLPAGLGGGLPWAGSGWPPAAALTALVVLGRWPRCCLAAAAAGAILYAAAGAPADGGTAIRFLDVGQGDAALIDDGGAGLLVDGGGWWRPGLAEKALLPALGRLRLRRLAVVVLSHGDRDHCRGLLELAGYVPFGEVWLAPGTARSDCARRLTLLPGVRVRPLWAGERAGWQSWRFEAVSPEPGRRGHGNEDSLVLRATSRGRSVLLTGDIGSRTEGRLLRRPEGAPAALSLLKVAHHGSASSSSTAFLRSVRPRLAVISAGRSNPFGHPAPAVLERLSRAGIPVLRTDLSGLVEVRWHGPRAWHVSTPGAGG
ncbi:MAG: DNA internalization-related competence protein ComEC/Rec2 [Acidobacteriota bacterium]|nr:DNA internalization-related competence protein ComEC/Rec2 [Acidobacteriota bacterium]